MSHTRRNFLKNSVLAGSAAIVGAKSSLGQEHSQAANKTASPSQPTKTESTSKTQTNVKPLKILILGGTGLIGPYQVQYALDRGHKVTLFNRGKTRPGLFPQVEHLQGDRNTGDLKSLQGREWDVVIDNPTTKPSWVRDVVAVLKNSTKQYVFISTISVYADASKVGMDETAELATTKDPEPEKNVLPNYGPLKAMSEAEAEKGFPGRTTIIRPGLIVGPGDYSDRFSYWPLRIDRGGEILAPGDPNDPVQIIDARDLGEWCIRMVEDGNVGIYNAVGPKTKLSIAEMLYGIKAVTTADVKFTWVDASFLEQHKVQPWSDMPVWVPPIGEYKGFAQVNISKAINKGLTFRPLAVTAKDTLDWFKALPADRQAKLRSGIDPKRETEVLLAWNTRNDKK